MISFEDIKDVHLEISTICNASCPWCPRNFWGYPFNGGYPETVMTLSNAKQIFQESFIRQLESIRVNGNFGDIVMNPQSPDILEFFRTCNQKLVITVNTNGGARTPEFWQRLAYLGCRVRFAIDGLEQTHALYRQNTVWNTVINNAKIFIQAGGYAVWQMIKFKHNYQEIEQCRDMAFQLGFMEFDLIDQGRDTAPVFDQKGNLTHVLGDYTGETRFEILWHKKQTDEVLLEDIVRDRTPKDKISCETKRLKSIYIAANGDVSPCCYLGFYPATYGKGQYHQAANQQLKSLIRKNNALEYPLQQCVEWFHEVETSWQQRKYEQGRLVICDDNCGSDL